MHDLIIIGAGPAGLTAGIYAGRYRLKTVILEKMGAGGQIILSPAIENFPGFPQAIATADLVDNFKKQVEDLGINIELEEAESIEEVSVSGGLVYKVKSATGSYEAKSIIIASGATSKALGIEGEKKFIGRGVSYCGTCDAPLFRDKEIAVIGAGDRAIEEAIFLSSYAAKVTIIHRRQQLRASKILQEKAGQNSKISFMLETLVEEISGKDRLEALKLKDVKTGSISVFPCQGVFIFAGIKPHTEFLNNLLNLDNSGFIITDEDMQASRKGIFACGDCRKKSLYQVITACAEGAVAASSAQRYLL